MRRNLESSAIYQSSTSYDLHHFHLFQTEMAIGRPESCRAATNCLMFSWKGPDGSSPSTKIFCRLGNTSVPTTSWRAAATPGAKFLDTRRFFTAGNGSKSSNHRVFSMASFFQTRREYRCLMRRSSIIERGGKQVLQTWATDESCQSGSLHEIFIQDKEENSTLAVLSSNSTCASSFLSAGVRLMNWASRGPSKSI